MDCTFLKTTISYLTFNKRNEIVVIGHSSKRQYTFLFPDKYEGILSLTRMPDDNDLIPFIESKVADGSFQESTIHGLLIHRPGDSPQYTVELTTADEVLNALNP